MKKTQDGIAWSLWGGYEMNVPRFDARKKNSIFSPYKRQNCPSDPLGPPFRKYRGLFLQKQSGGGNMTATSTTST